MFQNNINDLVLFHMNDYLKENINDQVNPM